MATRGGFLVGAGALASGLLTGEAAASGAEPTSGTLLVPPEALWNRLIEGNQRFMAGDLPPDVAGAERRAMMAEGQSPFAAILTCADSRILPNHVFTQDLGDLFVCRIAGNYASDDVLGSLEYAVANLGTRLIVVLGHEKCGAVKAVYDAIAQHKALPPHLDAIERGMRDGIAPVVKSSGDLESAMRANVRAAVRRISEAPPVLRHAVETFGIKVVGAEYHLRSGAVTALSRGA